MNRTIYKVLGVAALLCIFLLVSGTAERAAELPPEDRSLLYWGTAAMVGVCLAIAAACFFPRSHPVSLRILGAIGIASSIFYLVENIREGRFIALGPALLFWLPGSLYLAIAGKLTLPPPKQKK